MAENSEGAEKLPEVRNPAFIQLEEKIIEIALSAEMAVERLRNGDELGAKISLGAVRASARLAIGKLRQTELGPGASRSLYESDEFASMMAEIRSRKYPEA